MNTDLSIKTSSVEEMFGFNICKNERKKKTKMIKKQTKTP
jgi:hypothetical protein